MKRGDLVLHEFKNTFGVLLEIRIDQKLMKHTFSVPWRYCVLWNNGHISEHDIGTLKRVRIHNQNYSYYSKKEKTMKKKKEKEWVQVVENEDGSTSAVFDLDSQKEDMIKRLYNVEVITEDILQKFLRDALNNLENNYQENLEWPEWKPNDEKQTPEVKKISPKKKTISKKKKTATK